MISNLKVKDFIKKLEENTTIGNPKIKGTPFSIWTKPVKTSRKFYGEFDKTSFRLTKNSISFPIPYIFVGEFNSCSKSSTEVSINVKPIWFGYLWIRILPVVALILINSMLVTEDTDVEVFILVNIFLVIMFSPILFINRQKNKFRKDFYKILEIIE